MTNDYSTDADVVGDALEAVFLKKTALAQSVTNGDSTHAPSGDAVYDFVTGLVGDAITYINL